MSTDGKSLAQMTAEVVENNTAKGWYENCATFPEAMALLHSEVSEALDAWRHWGLEDKTGPQILYRRGDNGEDIESLPPYKPEGVPSEFADIFIRLLDDCYLFGVDPEVRSFRPGRFGIDESFVANMNTMHGFIARASAAREDSADYGEWFGNLLVFLRQLCGHYGVDLMAEYEKKMDYNRTREYRHGDKRI